LFGGSRSGKTFILIYAIIVRACKEKSRHIILRKHFNHVKRSIVLDTFPKVMALCFPNLKAKLNKTDYYVSLPNGSEIFFGGLDDGERVEKILGTEFSTLYFNEASEIDYSSVMLVLTRLAEKNNLTKKVYIDFNPPTKSHWSYHLFIKKLDPRENKPLKDELNYTYLKMNPEDNLINLDEDYLSMLESLPDKERERFLHGDFADESDGQVYYSFLRDKHLKNLTKNIGTIFIGMDFNVNPMTAVVCQLIDGKLNVFDEIFLQNSDTYKMCHELKKRNYTGATIIPDSTGRNRKTSGMSDFQILEQAGFKIRSTHNPFVGDRINNVNRCFQQDLCLISPSCGKLIFDLEKVSWKNGDIDKRTDPMLSHISDALGYALYSLLPFNKFEHKMKEQER